MYRRRRPPAREPVFGFDSFLDVVANVCGIIIRLILVAWVGARAYHSLTQLNDDEEPPPAALAAAKATQDPLHPQVVKAQLDLAEARARLLDHLKQLNHLQEIKTTTSQELKALALEEQKILKQRLVLDKSLTPPPPSAGIDLSLAELRQRSQAVKEQILALEKQSSAKKTYRYHSPVSRPVHAEELMFECQAGRVTFIDLAALLGEVKRGLHGKADLLKNQWHVTETAGPVGVFRLRYTLERERGLFENGISQPQGDSFRYGLTGWKLEPIVAVRGEPLEQALAPGSAFRRVLDGQDLGNTVVTFWVYPDSFGLFRQLRDFLYEQGAEVAGRPLPEGTAIAASRHGTASRGQ